MPASQDRLLCRTNYLFKFNAWPIFTVLRSPLNDLYIPYSQTDLNNVRSILIESAMSDLGSHPSSHFRLPFNRTCEILAQGLRSVGLNGLAELSVHDAIASSRFRNLTSYWVDIVSHLTGSWAMEVSKSPHYVLEVLTQKNIYGSSLHGAVLRWVTLSAMDDTFWPSAMALFEPYVRYPDRILQFDVFHPIGHGLLFRYAYNKMNIGTFSACTMHIMQSDPASALFPAGILQDMLGSALAMCDGAPGNHEAVWCAQGAFHTFFNYFYIHTTGSTTALWPCSESSYQPACFWWLHTHKASYIQACASASSKETELACIFGYSAARFRQRSMAFCGQGRTAGISLLALFCNEVALLELTWLSVEQERRESCIDGSLDTLTRMKYTYANSTQALLLECLGAGVDRRKCATKLSDMATHVAEWRVF